MSMSPLKPRERTMYEYSTQSYSAQLWEPAGSVGLEYFRSRGLDDAVIKDFRLGYVSTPINEDHDQFVGMPCIPNLSGATDQHPVGLKFRNLAPDSRMKYTQPSGQVQRLFNLRALNAPGDTIYVTEGEFDAICLNMVGLPAIAAPGTNAWGRENQYRNSLMDGRTVVLCRDSDQAGDHLVNDMRSLDDLVVRLMTPSKDTNDFLLEFGREALYRRAVGKDE